MSALNFVATHPVLMSRGAQVGKYGKNKMREITKQWRREKSNTMTAFSRMLSAREEN